MNNPKVLQYNKQCENEDCNNVFTLLRKKPKQKYCSKECCDEVNAKKYPKVGVIVTKKDVPCANEDCNNTFDVTNKTNGKKYCSPECYPSSRGINTVINKKEKCQNTSCNKTFALMSNSPNKKYCSHECGVEVRKQQTVHTFVITETQTKQILSKQPVVQETQKSLNQCHACYVFFPGKSGEYFCSDSCRKSATRPRTHYDIFNRDGFRCNYCGKSPMTDPSVELTLDHVRPWVQSRDDRACNILTACRQCNSEKLTSRAYNEEEIYKIIYERNLKFNIDPNTLVRASIKHRLF